MSPCYILMYRTFSGICPFHTCFVLSMGNRHSGFLTLEMLLSVRTHVFQCKHEMVVVFHVCGKKNGCRFLRLEMFLPIWSLMK